MLDFIRANGNIPQTDSSAFLLAHDGIFSSLPLLIGELGTRRIIRIPIDPFLALFFTNLSKWESDSNTEQRHHPLLPESVFLLPNSQLMASVSIDLHEFAHGDRTRTFLTVAIDCLSIGAPQLFLRRKRTNTQLPNHWGLWIGILVMPAHIAIPVRESMPCVRHYHPATPPVIVAIAKEFDRTVHTLQPEASYFSRLPLDVLFEVLVRTSLWTLFRSLPRVSSFFARVLCDGASTVLWNRLGLLQSYLFRLGETREWVDLPPGQLRLHHVQVNPSRVDARGNIVTCVQPPAPGHILRWATLFTTRAFRELAADGCFVRLVDLQPHRAHLNGPEVAATAHLNAALLMPFHPSHLRLDEWAGRIRGAGGSPECLLVAQVARCTDIATLVRAEGRLLPPDPDRTAPPPGATVMPEHTARVVIDWTEGAVWLARCRTKDSGCIEMLGQPVEVFVFPRTADPFQSFLRLPRALLPATATLADPPASTHRPLSPGVRPPALSRTYTTLGEDGCLNVLAGLPFRISLHLKTYAGEPLVGSQAGLAYNVDVVEGATGRPDPPKVIVQAQPEDGGCLVTLQEPLLYRLHARAAMPFSPRQVELMGSPILIRAHPFSIPLARKHMSAAMDEFMDAEVSGGSRAGPLGRMLSPMLTCLAPAHWPRLLSRRSQSHGGPWLMGSGSPAEFRLLARTYRGPLGLRLCAMLGACGSDDCDPDDDALACDDPLAGKRGGTALLTALETTLLPVVGRRRLTDGEEDEGAVLQAGAGEVIRALLGYERPCEARGEELVRLSVISDVQLRRISRSPVVLPWLTALVAVALSPPWRLGIREALFFARKPSYFERVTISSLRMVLDRAASGEDVMRELEPILRQELHDMRPALDWMSSDY
ncbi:hypothetical protein PAPYR_7717 [Paratrimastix pyriformis]|uniref:F-box domain-containing protein n=1 Tax=Paratrimastix pyriformis TaxID=342808 RepID=A0ABQ8UGS6_9EUKA|nr:hypothetical protein PAPYR_7717 [Paratrimastix pyriformis]